MDLCDRPSLPVSSTIAKICNKTGIVRATNVRNQAKEFLKRFTFCHLPVDGSLWVPSCTSSKAVKPDKQVVLDGCRPAQSGLQHSLATLIVWQVDKIRAFVQGNLGSGQFWRWTWFKIWWLEQANGDCNGSLNFDLTSPHFFIWGWSTKQQLQVRKWERKKRLKVVTVAGLVRIVSVRTNVRASFSSRNSWIVQPRALTSTAGCWTGGFLKVAE